MGCEAGVVAVRFQAYSPSIQDIDKVVVDGNDCGRGLQLSHWPGNTTPPELKSDLSVEITLRLLAAGDRKSYLGEREIITNDHFDTDGLLSIWALLNPVVALDHSRKLVDAAAASDFYEFTTPDAVKFDLIVLAFNDPDRSPLGRGIGKLSSAHRQQAVTEALLDELPSLLYDTGRYRELWEEEYRRLEEEIKRINSGRVSVREHVEERLSVITTPEPLSHYGRDLAAHGQRMLEIIPTGSGARYVGHYRFYLWYDIVSRPTSPKHDLAGTAERLNRLEPGLSGGWAVTGWTPFLYFDGERSRSSIRGHYRDSCGESALPPRVVEEAVCEEFCRLDRDVSSWGHPNRGTALTGGGDHIAET
jgi:hypothetical protein